MDSEMIQVIANIATAVGVLLVCLQLWLAKRRAVTAFEDTLAKEFRETVKKLPVRALLGEPLDERERQQYLNDFYRYVDLTNSQVFLRQIGRISKKTWAYWRDGIRDLLALPAFADAWGDIKERAPNSFEELRYLEKEGFKTDPRDW